MKDLGTFIPFVLIVAVFWLLVIRPARKRQRDVASVQSSVGPGTEVMLGSGIYGRVTSVTDDTVWLELAPGTTVKVARQAVVRVVDDPLTPTDGAQGTEGGEGTASGFGSQSDVDPGVDSALDPGSASDSPVDRGVDLHGRDGR